MQTYFESELDKLKKRTIKMFELVVEQVKMSFKILNEPDIETIEQIKQTESKVDKLDVKIDKLCQRIFALSQPVATDLRFIMSSLRIGGEMERIGDLAFDISKHLESLAQVQNLEEKYNLNDLLQQVESISLQTQEAYVNTNSFLASKIIEESHTLNDLCDSIFKKVIAEMSEKSDVIFIATDLILIINNLGRIIAHFRNISESIIFIGTGKIVKHNTDSLTE